MADKVAEKDEIKAEVPAETDQASTEDAEFKSKPKPKKGKRVKRNVPTGQVHILATFNNTIVTVSDTKGNVLTTASSGSSGFKGSKKGTAYAAQMAAERAVTAAKKTFGLSKVDVFVKGYGLGREAAIRTIAAQNIGVENVKDLTGIPHGGVRPRAAKRN